MKVKYIGKEIAALEKGKIYNVISVEKGWFRIMTEIGDDYLFPPSSFEITEETDQACSQADVSPSRRASEN